MTAAAWYPDPMNRHELRWFDGEHWTAAVSDQGVTAQDPLFTEGPHHSTWAAPTVSVGGAAPLPSVVEPGGEPAHPRRKTVIIATAAVVAAALGVGGWLVMRDDSQPATLGDVTTTATSATSAPSGSTTTAPATTAVGGSTTAPATTAPATTTPATTAPTTTTTVLATTTTATAPPVDVPYDAQQLTKALTIQKSVPSDWGLKDGTDSNPYANESGATCNGPNDVSRALANNSVAEVYGPTFALPHSAFFGVDAFSFGTEKAADAFLTSSVAQVKKCATTAVVAHRSEKDVGSMSNSFYDDAVWRVEHKGRYQNQAATGVDRIVAILETVSYSMKYSGKAFSYRYQLLQRYERHGNLVLVFWLDGENHFSGFSNYDPNWEYSPTLDALGARTRTARPLVMARLAKV
jgi:hypothetical protein